MALAYLTINLDDFTGDDHPPISQYSTITLDPGADHIDTANDVIHVRTIVVSLDRQGKAATANGVPCVDGKVPVVAGVAYAVSAPNVLRGGPHYVPALTAGQVVDLSDYITPGAPLTPDQAATLTARIVALEATPPGGGGSTTVTGGAARPLAFAAVALASCDTAPAKFLFAGDSLTVGNDWPKQFTKRLTHQYLPGVTPLVPTVTTVPADFTVPSTGIFGVTTAISGANSANYATNNNLVAVATKLQPHAVFHCIGTNDYDSNVAPATFKSNVVAAIDAIDAVLSKPAVHVLHHFSSAYKTGRVYSIDDYMAMMIEIANEAPNLRVAVDLGPFADVVGIQGADPYLLDSGDGVHLTTGNRLWGDLMARVVTAAPSMGVLGWSRPAPVVDSTAPTWTATLTTGSPGDTSVTVTASALASDNIGVTAYDVSTDAGATWGTASRSGSTFTISGLTSGTNYPAPRFRARDASGNLSGVLSAQAFTTTFTVDTTNPTPGTRAVSAITDTEFTMTVSGASDAVGLHATPYAFTTNGGTTWSAYQSSPIYVASGLTGGTVYATNHRVRDAAGNVTTGTAANVTTSTPITPFTDNFNRADSTTTLGSPWEQLAGVCGISSNQAYRVSGNAIAAVPFSQADMTVSVKVVATAAYFAGPAARIVPGAPSFGTMYTVDTGGGTTASLLRIVDGTAASIGGGSFAFVLGDTLGISCKEVSGGTEVKLLINGVVMTTVTDSTATRPMGTRGGIRPNASTIRLDDFSITGPQ